MKQILYFVILLPIIELIVACCHSSPHTYVVDPGVPAISIIDFRGEAPEDVTGFGVGNKSLGIRLELALEVVENLEVAMVGSSVYATTCPMPELNYQHIDSISDIVFKTVYSLNDSVPEGSDITHLFKGFVDKSGKPLYQYQSIQRFLDHQYLQASYKNDFSSELKVYYDFMLMTDITNNVVKLEVEITLTNGNTFSLETTEVTVDQIALLSVQY
ncbi:MAG: DUF5034 domain-containing protein [Fibrobacterales bacterium]